MERTNQGRICVFVDVYPVYAVAIHWWMQGGGHLILFLDQTEARRVETTFV